MHIQPLADAYGLLMHRNGQWEWTLAPGVSPSPRYQHAAVSGRNVPMIIRIMTPFVMNCFSNAVVSAES